MPKVVKRLPIDEAWSKRAFCKGRNPELWDLDFPNWTKGRLKCIKRCPVREDCLRKAFRSYDFRTSGVVRGGVAFDEIQVGRKTVICLFCKYPTARLDEFGVPGLCWICRRYAPCIKKCGRLVRRKPHMDSYHCGQCDKEGNDIAGK